MARPNKIWFRKDIGWWMVTIHGEYHRLAQGKENKKLAERKFHELKAVAHVSPESPNARVADVIESFISWMKTHRSAETLRNVEWYGQAFSEHSGYIRAIDLKPLHLTQWISEEKWGPTTERNARRSIYRAFSWAVEEGMLASNPLKGMKCPAAKTRQRCMSDEEFRLILRNSSKEFKILMFTLRETGCRPKEARTLKWDSVQKDRWVLAEHKTVGKTEKPRVIFLTRPMQNLMALLRRTTKSENVFVNARGKQWTVNAMRLRMERIKDNTDLPKDVVPYLLRHAFGTQAILNGVDVITVAHLMGHNSLEMINRVYVHLADKQEHLHQAVAKARRREPATPSQVVRNSGS